MAEVQAEDGMELPPELIEALKSASTGSFGSLDDFETGNGSQVSSLITKQIEFEDDKSSSESRLRNLVLENFLTLRMMLPRQSQDV